MKNVERDLLCITILELVKKDHVHYTDIEKKAVATCLRFATSNTVRKQFYHYLLLNGYVERVGRGVYRITQKERKAIGNLGIVDAFLTVLWVCALSFQLL